MRIRPYIEAAFARDWEFDEVDHYPLSEDLNNSLRPLPASFSRESEKNVIEGEMLVRKDSEVPVFLDGYLDLSCNGLMLEQYDFNMMLQTGNMLVSPWINFMDMNASAAPGISPSSEYPAFRINLLSQGANWGHAYGQNLPSANNETKVMSAMIKGITDGKIAALGNHQGRGSGINNNGVYVPLITGDISQRGSDGRYLAKDVWVGDWRYIEQRRTMFNHWNNIYGFEGIRSGSWSFYGFAVTIQERFYSSKIFSTNVPGIREPDILTVKSPQGLKQNKISFDFQYMTQGHSQEYEAVNINGEISVYIREISTSEPNPVENEPDIIIKKSRFRVRIRGEQDTDYNFQDIVTPDVKDATYNVEILSTRGNNIRVKITVNDEEHEADGILRGDVLLDENMTISGWCVLSNLKVYEGY